jgi:hypothetical protein
LVVVTPEKVSIYKTYFAAPSTASQSNTRAWFATLMVTFCGAGRGKPGAVLGLSDEGDGESLLLLLQADNMNTSNITNSELALFV